MGGEEVGEAGMRVRAERRREESKSGVGRTTRAWI